ncbi:MAG: ABC-F family ATP-binding cassette domain-containing protein [Bacteroidetes bacterium]|nr:ABC-F family ATP-binding cassette domain-containing protein [Bacteroidota bacterium]
MILVSHDRAFLDAVTNRTIEITRGTIEDYSASYSRYVEMRAERRAMNLAAYKNQQREIERTEEFIERFRYKASLASRVQSRVKMLDKIDRIEPEEEDLAAIAFSFPPAPRSGLIVAQAENLYKKYGDKTVLHGIDFELGRGDRAAFVGKNGEGKTTFSKILAGTEIYDGQLVIGHNVVIGYYAQHQAESLDGNSTVFEIIDNAATGDMRTRIRSLLGAFLFSGDDVYKKVKILSGGEKSRLALAKLLLQPSNLLILDEPTNHLDMRAKDVLKRALLNYDGSLVVVSHDREFLQGLTSKVYEFRGGKIRETPGDIYEFLRLRQLENLQQLEKSRQSLQAKPAAESDRKANVPPDREERKRIERERRRLERRGTELEYEIAEYEKRVAELENIMSKPDFYSSGNSSDLLLEYEKEKRKLDADLDEWTAINESLESIANN